MKLSIIIPAKDEQETIYDTITDINIHLKNNQIDHEIIVINDYSTDSTLEILKSLKKNINQLIIINNSKKSGFGIAIRQGLDIYSGDTVAIVMADGSDSSNDLINFYNESIMEGKCIFGSRFSKGGSTKNYPFLKYILNRMFNNCVRLIFRIRYNDFTNAFKVYTREALEGSKPLISNHFNLTLELPLKIIIRGYNYKILPNSWKNRKAGMSKLKIKEMGSRYLFILFYCLIEKLLTKDDYKKVR